MEDFVHLHVHTQYSILDGQASIPKLIEKAVKDGMRGFAVTDHGNMMGIKEFYDVSMKTRSKGKVALKKSKEKLEELQQQSADEAQLEEVRREVAKQERIANFTPIFGCEMYVARRGMKIKETKEDMSGHHLIVLAKNSVGYHNLVKLVSNAWVDGYYMRPRTDHEELEKYHEGLIICSACVAGEVPNKIINGDIAGAEESVLWFKNIFGEDYYLELQRHKVIDPQQRANREAYELQQKINPVLVQLAQKHGIKLICSNDVHFVDEENAEAHDRLICLSTGKDLDDPKRMLYSKQEWFKTRAEMNTIFSDVPEALSNTIEVLNKVEVYDINHAPIMPNFEIPEDFGTEEGYRKTYSEEDLFKEFTRDENGNVVMSDEEGRDKISKLGGYDKLYRIKLEADYLGKLAYEGAKRRYGNPIPENVAEQVKFELHIMKTMGFPGYFLIVQDYIAAARNQLDVSVGPGRGSAAGSVVAYCLGITQVDPIKYDLLFERFLNPDRISLPDIDVDFDDDGRDRVLQWVTDKYGEENVAHIITYGTMQTKLAIKDVARVEKLPLSVSNSLCKLIPEKLPDGPDGKPMKMNLENIVKCLPEFQKAEASDDPKLRDTIRYAKMLEGNVRNTGVHACGFIICRDKISDWVPVSIATDKSGEKLHCTQYEGKVIEDTGLIKMDFLGLKTLSIIKEALSNIKDSFGVEIDIENIDIEDPATYQLYCDGNTTGTFQFESIGMQRNLRELQPSTFEDLIAMNALYRPGPMAYIPKFIARKHGKEAIKYDLDCMEEYLKDTYGITVYQEQVMLLSRKIANFTRGESDTLRKAMGKKLIDKLNHMYPKFISGGKANGHDEKTLEKIWDDWRAFASYAFNKSHATCYSWVAYQTAYLKAHYPAQYMAAVMSRNLDKITEVSKLMDECKLMGIRTLSPDVNESRRKFSVNDNGDIRFGLAAIKGVGANAADAIIEERLKNGPYKTPYEFMERCNFNVVNRKCIESLVLAGAFDSFTEYKREQYVTPNPNGGDFLDVLIKYGNNYQIDKKTQQNSLFGGSEAIEIAHPPFPEDYTTWSDLERLNKEKDLIGIFISSHPLQEYKVILKKVCNTRCSELEEKETLKNRELLLAGIVTGVRRGNGKNGRPYAIVKIEDFDGTGEVVLFGDDSARWGGYMSEGSYLFIKAKMEQPRYGDKLYLHIEDVKYLSDIKSTAIRDITINLDLSNTDETTISEVSSILQEHNGNVPLYFTISGTETTQPVLLKSGNLSVDVTGDFIDKLDMIHGIEYSVNKR